MQAAEEIDGVVGKRPGQFGILTLFILMTVAAIACAIVRLPIHPVGKLFSLVALWICFSVWSRGKPDAQQAASLAYRRRVAVLNAIGSIITFAPFVWVSYHLSARPLSFADAAFWCLAALSPAHAIWQAVQAIRAELYQKPVNAPGEA